MDFSFTFILRKYVSIGILLIKLIVLYSYYSQHALKIGNCLVNKSVFWFKSQSLLQSKTTFGSVLVLCPSPGQMMVPILVLVSAQSDLQSQSGSRSCLQIVGSANL